jgi:polyhydroxybutyrate depolymerase
MAGAWALALVWGACVLSLAAQAQTRPQPSDADADLHPLAFEGGTRQYLLRLPPGPPADPKGWPLVVVFHGGGGDALNAERMTDFTALGRREGFAVLYPQGTPAAGQRLGTWNAVHCCGTAMRQRTNDTRFVVAALDDVQRRHPIDRQRLYATGLSNGGMMVHRVAATYPERWAAVAPVVASLFGDEPLPAAPVPVFIVNGELDASVPVDGGAPGGRFRRSWGGQPLLPVSSQSRFWAEANGCQVGPDKRFAPTHVHWQYSCPKGRDVERVLVIGVGHAWPGGQRGAPGADDPGTAYQATQAIWGFFKRHRRP